MTRELARVPRRNDVFYRLAHFFGSGVLNVCSRSVILHRERTQREGGFLLAANHLSPFDVPCLMKASSRALDFVSIVEVFETPFVAWLYGSLNAMPLDRHNQDLVTVREIVQRLRTGRVVAIFPEGRIHRPGESVLLGGAVTEGFGQMAMMADVPIVPCVVLGSKNFYGVSPWLPFRHTRYAMAFGEPLRAPKVDAEGSALGRARSWRLLEEQWRASMVSLYDELSTELRERRGFGSLLLEDSES
ncbi:MAG: lysophospholipid acyltransferase family protein [Acidobacteriota bacterium]